MSNRDSRRHTTRNAADTPFTFGAIGCRVDLWNGDWNSDSQTDSVAIDTILGVAASSVGSAVNALNKDVLTRQSVGQAPAGSTKYVTTKTMTIEGKTLRVKVRIDMFVKVPSPVLVVHAENILADLVTQMAHILDPEGIPSVIHEFMEQVDAFMMQEFFRACYPHSHTMH